MKMNFSAEAIASIAKFGAAIEQPQSVNSNSFAHNQAFIAWLEDKSGEFECSVISFTCTETPTAKISRTPFAVKQNEGERVEYINSARPDRLQMNGTAEIAVPEFGKSVKIRMSVATFAAIYGLEKCTLRAQIGAITIGEKAKRGEKWLSVSSTISPDFANLLLALTAEDVKVQI